MHYSFAALELYYTLSLSSYTGVAFYIYSWLDLTYRNKPPPQKIDISTVRWLTSLEYVEKVFN